MANNNLEQEIARRVFAKTGSKDSVRKALEKYRGMTSTPASSNVNSFVKNKTKKADRSAIGEFALGAGKGALSTISGISELGQRGLSKLTGVGPVGGEVTKLPEQLTKPEGTAQKAGFATEQIGEFLIPGLAGTKAAKAPQAANLISKIAKGSAVGAGEAAAISAAQEGEINKQVGTTAAFGAAGPLVGAAVTKPLKKVGEFTAGLTVPTTPTEFGKDLMRNISVGKTVQEKVGFSLTKKSLLNKLEKKTKPLVNAVDDLIDRNVATKGEKFRAADVLKGVEDAVVSDAKTLNLAPHQIEALRPKIREELSQIAKFYKGDLDARDLQTIKKELAIDKLYKGAVDKTLTTENAVIREAASNFRKKVEDVVPGVKELNKDLVPLITAAERIRKKPSFRSGLFYDAIIGSGYAGNPADAVRDPVNYFKNFLQGVAVRRGLSSTASKTAFASFTNKFDKLAQNPAFIQSLREFYEQSSNINQE